MNAKTIIEKSTKSINTLLDDLKSEAEFRLTNISIQNILEIAIEFIKPKLTEKNATIETSLKNINVLVDETRVLNVLLNIMSNAVFALGQNGKLKVEVEENKDNTISVLIENDGEAISKENQKRIFEEGFTTKKESGGSGLGLKIAKSSMQKMNGDLRLIKSDEKSTIFEIKMKKVEDGGVK